MAITFAVAYLLCVLAPTAVLAAMGSVALRHCLTGAHHHKAAMVRADAHAHARHAAGHDHGPAAPGSAHASRHDHPGSHQHADAAHHQAGAAHASPAEGDGGGADSGCCGVFCVSAMPAGPIADLVPLPGMLAAAAAAEPGIAGRGPGRIDRPPNFSLPQ